MSNENKTRIINYAVLKVSLDRGPSMYKQQCEVFAIEMIEVASLRYQSKISSLLLQNFLELSSLFLPVFMILIEKTFVLLDEKHSTGRASRG